MTIDAVLWSQLEVYLFIDRKLSRSKGSYQSIKSRYFLLCEYFKLKQFSRSEFNLFILSLQQKNHTNSYINGFIKLAKHIGRFFKTEEFEDYTYFKEQKIKNYETLTKEEIDQIIALNIPYVRRREEVNQRNKTAIAFLAGTGCRISELIFLTWDDIFGGEIPTVIFRETKNGEQRQIPITKQLYEMLMKLPRLQTYVFGIRDKTELYNDLKRRAAQVTHKKVWLHLLRHSYATNAKGIQIEDLSILLGHKNIQSTMIYKHAALTHLNEVIYTHPFNAQNQTRDFKAQGIKKLLSMFSFGMCQIEESDEGMNIKILF